MAMPRLPRPKPAAREAPGRIAAVARGSNVTLVKEIVAMIDRQPACGIRRPPGPGTREAPACSTRLSIKLTAVWLLGVVLLVPHGAQARPASAAVFSAGAGCAVLDQRPRARCVGDALTILVPPPTAPMAMPAGGKDALPVTIAELRPDGTALVRGGKQMLPSQGGGWVRLAGVVRLSDIAADRTITAARIADRRIEYSGKGALQRASRQGWLGRLFDIVSPS